MLELSSLDWKGGVLQKSSNIRMHSSFSRGSRRLKNHDAHSAQSFMLKLKLKGISLLLLYFLASSEFLWGVRALPTCIISTSRLPNMVGGLL